MGERLVAVDKGEFTYIGREVVREEGSGLVCVRDYVVIATGKITTQFQHSFRERAVTAYDSGKKDRSSINFHSEMVVVHSLDNLESGNKATSLSN